MKRGGRVMAYYSIARDFIEGRDLERRSYTNLDYSQYSDCYFQFQRARLIFFFFFFTAINDSAQ